MNSREAVEKDLPSLKVGTVGDADQVEQVVDVGQEELIEYHVL